MFYRNKYTKNNLEYQIYYGFGLFSFTCCIVLNPS
jgi:hypothetical protein